jgi:hypothetical protein
LTRRFLAAAAVVLVALTACTRGSGSTSNATPLQVYTAGPTLSQVRGSLGGDQLWWPATPTFGVRPLDLEFTPESVRFTITQRYIHLGTPESLVAEYVVYTSSSGATTQMTNITNGLGSNTASGPKVGDQVIYTGQKLATATALYDTVMFIRQGQILISVDLKEAGGFSDVKRLAKIGESLVSRLKDVLANKIRPTPPGQTDDALLPPAGTDVTLVGAARVPIEVAADMFGASSPEAFISSFRTLGLNDFEFGDYALDADLHMEVRTATFTFTSATDASSWMDQAIGLSNLNQNGQATSYIDATGKYYGFFLQGRFVGFMTCGSTAATEAAARACETPFIRVLDSWQLSLSQQS